MILHIYNTKGHVKTEGTTEEIIAEVERFMNANGQHYTLLAEKPGEEAGVRVSGPAALRDLDPETKVTLLPQLAGGEGR